MTATADRYRSIRTVLWAVLVLNLAVAAAKLVYGIISHSAAMEADGFASLFDGASNVIGLVGMWFAAQPADAEQVTSFRLYRKQQTANGSRPQGHTPVCVCCMCWV